MHTRSKINQNSTKISTRWQPQYLQFSLTLLSFNVPNLIVKTGRSFSKFAQPVNDRFQGCWTPACSAGMLSPAGKADIHETTIQLTFLADVSASKVSTQQLLPWEEA